MTIDAEPLYLRAAEFPVSRSVTDQLSRDECLLAELRFLEPAFGNLAGLSRDYVRAFPVDDGCGACADADRMLWWLESHFELSDRQRDYITSVRSRQFIESHRQDPVQLRWFKQLRRQFRPDARIRLNPTRIWNRLLSTEFLDKGSFPPCNALFFATTEGVSSVTLELEHQVLLNELAEFQPCTVETWASLSRMADNEQLSLLCRSLANLQLVAFE